MSDSTIAEALKFEPPQERDEKGWDFAEQQALAFPERYREKCKQLATAQRELAEVRGAIDKQFGLVVRNLIAMIDTCQAFLAEHPPAAEAADGDSGQLSAMALGKVVRASTQLLEQLGVVPIDLMGLTYETVVVNGQKVDDPFEVLEATTKGSAMSTPVSKVESPLWVLADGGKVRIVRKGMVCL